eukprot:COSAG01_NODE_14204_length_1483_cov_1.812861_2_plen_98_part_00
MMAPWIGALCPAASRTTSDSAAERSTVSVVPGWWGLSCARAQQQQQTADRQTDHRWPDDGQRRGEATRCAAAAAHHPVQELVDAPNLGQWQLHRCKL